MKNQAVLGPHEILLKQLLGLGMTHQEVLVQMRQHPNKQPKNQFMVKSNQKLGPSIGRRRQFMLGSGNVPSP